MMKRMMVCLLAAMLLLTACGRKESGAPDGDGMVRQLFHTVDRAEAERMAERDDGHVIVDVRRQDEYGAGHIPGAILIPCDSLSNERPEQLPDRDQIILVCGRGLSDTREAAAKLGKLGYYRIYEFGGIGSWSGELVSETEKTADTQNTPVPSEPPENDAERGDPIDMDSLPEDPQSHYVFRPKVCSVYLEELFGKAMCETWYHLVDAVMAGESTFACPDQHTYDWVMGQFPERCFPLLSELIDYAWDRENSVIDGVASFTYLVPPEEAAKRIQAFGEQVEGILNEALEDDYSDFEKVLALYDYFSRNYVYDYDTADRMENEYLDEIGSLRFFKEGTGVCAEFSSAYSYLLMQAGVEATIMSGNRSYDQAGHQWSYVRIKGRDYHIDPTYAIGDKNSLAYFMMTDEQREAEDCYYRSTFCITSNYAQDYPHPDYAATDDSFSAIWGYQFEAFFPGDDKLLCWRYDENGEKTYLTFDYSAFN